MADKGRIDAVRLHGGMGETLAIEIIILAADCWPETPGCSLAR